MVAITAQIAAGALLLVAPLLISATPDLIERNLAYRSPYTEHPALSIDAVEVHKRHLAARGEVESTISKRSKVPGPAGEADRYPSTYGLGVAKWESEWVYGGDLNFTHDVASGESSPLLHVTVGLWTAHADADLQVTRLITRSSSGLAPYLPTRKTPPLTSLSA